MTTQKIVREVNGLPQCIPAVLFALHFLILPIRAVVRTNKIFKTEWLQDRKGAIKLIHNEIGL